MSITHVKAMLLLLMFTTLIKPGLIALALITVDERH